MAKVKQIKNASHVSRIKNKDQRSPVYGSEWNALVTADNTISVDTISENTSANGVDIDGLKIKDNGLLNVLVPVVSGDSIDTAGAVTLTAAQSGTTYLVDKADGLAFTTPDSGAGDIIGCTYKFVVTTTITSNAFSITGGTTDNLFVGGVFMVDDTTPEAAAIFSPDVSDDDAFSTNGTTTGGKIGTVVTVTCVAADRWLIEGINVGSGTLATPFA